MDGEKRKKKQNISSVALSGRTLAYLT